MKRNISISIGLVFIIAIAFWWFKSRTSYINTIPKEAKCVVKIDLKSLTKQSEELLRAKENIKKNFGINLNGINAGEPIFLFITPNEYFVMVASTDDASILMASAKQWSGKWKVTNSDTDDDGTWFSLTNGCQLVINDKELILLGPGTAQERNVMRQTMRELIEEDASESYPETEQWQKLAKMKGDINMVASIDALPTPYNLFMRLALPQQIKANAVNIYSEIHFGNDGVEIMNQTEAKDEAVQKQLKSPTLQPQQLKGIFAANANCKDVAWLTMTAKGNELLEMLRNDATVRALLAALNQGIDADMMTKSIDGELSLRIPTISKDGTPEYALTAQLSNKKFENDIDYWKSSLREKKDMKLTNNGNGYLFSYKDKALYFGTKELNLYACSSQQLGNNPFAKKESKPINIPAKSYLYFRINVPELLNQPVFGKSGNQLVKSLLGNGELIEFNATSPEQSHLKIKMRSNPLEKLFNK